MVRRRGGGWMSNGLTVRDLITSNDGPRDNNNPACDLNYNFIIITLRLPAPAYNPNPSPLVPNNGTTTPMVCTSYLLCKKCRGY
jgi:hypothetical protein